MTPPGRRAERRRLHKIIRMRFPSLGGSAWFGSVTSPVVLDTPEKKLLPQLARIFEDTRLADGPW